jgi:hypothetical protein
MSELNAWDEATVHEEVSVDEIDRALQDYASKRSEYEAKKDLSNKADAECKESKRKLIEILKASGKSKWEVDGIGKASVTCKMTVRTPKDPESKKAMLTYMRSLGPEAYFGLINVNHQTLNSFYNEQKELNPEFKLPGVEDPVAEDNIRFTRSK